MLRVWGKLVSDARAQRWWLAAWVTMLLVQSIASLPETMLALRASVGEFRLWDETLTLVVLGQYGLAMAIVIRWMAADAASDSNAFWVSRPISRGEMLAAKVASIVLLLLVPSLIVNLALTLAAGLPLVRLPLAALEILARDSLFLVPVAAVASVTRDLARVVIFAAGTLVGPAILQVSATQDILDLSSGLRAPEKALIAALLLGQLVAVSVIVLQYLTRRTVRSTLILAAGGVSMLALFAAGTWLGREVPVKTEPATPAPSWFSASLDLADVKIPPVAGDNGLVQAGLRTSGMPGGHLVRVVRMESRLTLKDGRETTSTSNNGRIGLFSEKEWMRVVAGQLGCAWKTTRREREWLARLDEIDRRELAFEGPKTAIEKWKTDGGRYEADFEFAMAKPEVRQRIPIRSGASGQVGGTRVTILAVELAPKEVHIYARVDAPRLLSAEDSTGHVFWTLPIEALLMNPGRREVMTGTGGGADIARPRALNYMFGPVYVVPCVVEMRFGFGGADEGTTPEMRADWLANGELVLVVDKPAGRFTKHISVPFSKLGE